MTAASCADCYPSKTVDDGEEMGRLVAIQRGEKSRLGLSILKWNR